MKKLILFLLLLPSLAWGGDIEIARMNPYILGGGVGCTISNCSGDETCTGTSGCLIRETFDGCTGTNENGCDNTSCGSAPCLYYAVNRCTLNDASSPLEGAQDASCGGAVEMVELRFTASDEVYATAIIDTPDVTASTDRLMVQDASGNDLCKFTMVSSSMAIYNTGGTAKGDTEDFENSKKYYIKIRAKKGTGTNAECQGWASTDGTNWTFTTPDASTNGTWTAQPAKFIGYGSSATLTTRFDDMRVSTSDINY